MTEFVVQDSEHKGASTTEAIPATIAGHDGRESQARFEVHMLGMKDKLILAGKRLLLFWAVAGVFLPIPGFHFVLTPLFFVIGIVAAGMAFFVTREIQSGQGSCPVCGTELRFGRLRYRERFKEKCSQCRHDMFVTLK